MQRQIATKQPPPIPGVFSSIADGFSIAIWRPLIVVIPVLLDLYYWLGWKLEVGAFAVRLQRWMVDAGVHRTDSNFLEIARISQWDVATTPSFFFVPSLLSGVNPSRLYQFRARNAYSTAHWGFDLAILIGAFVLSMVVSAVFLETLGEKVRDRNRPWAARIREIGRIFLHLTGVTLIAIAVVVLIGGLVFAERVHNGEDIGPVFTVGLFVQFFLSLGLWFAPDAIVMARAGAFKAIKLSLGMFRRYFWSSVGFVVVSAIIGQGLHDVFVRISGNAPGLVLGVLAYAMVSCGLGMASFWFFNSRNQPSRLATNTAGSAPSR